jgi:GNAT superfamily N-acetyltransferase
MDIKIAIDEPEIKACFPAMRELRPHLSENDFVAQVQRQMHNHDYILVYLVAEEQIVAVAGYRVAEFLAWGRVLYVDDLVCRAAFQQHGYGGTLLDWLMAQAKTLCCDQFHLDSGMHRYNAHRLYLNRKLQITSHHFAKELRQSGV